MAVDSIIKIVGTVPSNATTDAISSIDIPEDGEILTVLGYITGIYEPAAAAGANISLRLATELSFLSSNQISTNDARGSIAEVRTGCTYFFSEAVETGGGGGKLSEQSVMVLNQGIPVFGGERIYMHGFSSDADLTADAAFMIYMKTRGGGRRASKRR